MKPIYRAAWRPAGNGIVERHHRSIKAMAERGHRNPIEAVYWYNISPKEGQKEDSVPHKAVHTYEWRMKGSVDEEVEEDPGCELKVGDEVWVKPADARCTSRWQEGTVAHVNSENNVEVDGMAKQVLDVRAKNVAEGDIGSEDLNYIEADGGEDVEDDFEGSQPLQRYPQRERTSPVWMRDFSKM